MHLCNIIGKYYGAKEDLKINFSRPYFLGIIASNIVEVAVIKTPDMIIAVLLTFEKSIGTNPPPPPLDFGILIPFIQMPAPTAIPTIPI